jgi:ubiquinol-cytochrome c reductase cytochrome b subunit
MSAEVEARFPRSIDWLSQWTTIDELRLRLLDSPSEGLSAWVRTSAGAVALLLATQMVTGVLLAFYYVPTIESAHTTVAYIEKVVGAGSLIRSVHYHCSQWLPVTLILHLAQLLYRKAYLRTRVAWTIGLLLLGLVLAAAASGYALPWDARSLNGASVGAGITGGLPFIGKTAQRWVLNGSEISTLTLSRFYGLHVFITPGLLLLCVIARLFMLRDKRRAVDEAGMRHWAREQLVRNAFVVSLVFIFMAILSAKFPAPLGPTADEAIGYLPRPGPQFLWLFEMLKYLPDRFASVFATAFPGLVIGGLAVTPWLRQKQASAATNHRHQAVMLLFVGAFGMAASLTGLAYFQDARDPRVSEQLAQQAKQETEFRAAPFRPKRIEGGRLGTETSNGTEQKASNTSSQTSRVTQAASESTSVAPSPAAYTQQCAKCHGPRGEGAQTYPNLVGLTTRQEERRTVEDLVGIINHPTAYGLESKMRSFANKLNESEKREVAEWIATLK